MSKIVYDNKSGSKSKLDSRDLEILIDCLEAGSESYEPDPDLEGDPDYEDSVNDINRIAKMIEIFAE